MYKSIVLIMTLGLALAACAPTPAPLADSGAPPLAGDSGPFVGNETEMLLAQFVEDFGQRLKNVSVLAPDAAAQMAFEYSGFVTPELLSAWQANPSQAPGRRTSSPWPDRIEVFSIQEISAEEYRVSASVVEATSDSQQRARSYAVNLTMKLINGDWRISSYTSVQ